jgi:class 3 adenylate cyclase
LHHSYGAATHARLYGRFNVEPVGEIALRGKDQPVGVYRIREQGMATGH